MNEKYLIGPTLYDTDEELYYCKVGLNDKKRTLLYTVWGKSEREVGENITEIIG